MTIIDVQVGAAVALPFHVGEVVAPPYEPVPMLTFDTDWVELPKPAVSVTVDFSGAGALSATAEKVWTPASIAGLGLWLDAGTLALADGAAVNTWLDASGLGRNAAPVGPAPTYKASGINGHPAVDFPGVDRRLIVAGWAAALAGKTQYTLFMVETPRQFDYRVIMGAPIWTSDWQWLVEHQAAGGGGYYWGHTVNAYRQVTAGMTLNTPTLWCLVHNNTVNSHSYQDGVERFPESYGPSGDMTGTVPVYAGMGDHAYFGAYYDGTYPIDSLIGEVIWYDHALTDQERLAVEGYLTAKFQIEPSAGRPTQLPALPPPGPLPPHLK